MSILAATSQPLFLLGGATQVQGRRPVQDAAPEVKVGRTEHVHKGDFEDTIEISPEAEAAAGEQLSEEEQTQIEKLKVRDREVRAHEQAHLAAAGPYAKGGPTFSYQKGPDGQRYAIGGEVQIDTSPVPGDPEATMRKARVIRQAATAPSEPSSQDQAVAASASQLEVQARVELQAKGKEERAGSTSSSDKVSVRRRDEDSDEASESDAVGTLLDALI